MSHLERMLEGVCKQEVRAHALFSRKMVKVVIHHFGCQLGEIIMKAVVLCVA